MRHILAKESLWASQLLCFHCRSLMRSAVGWGTTESGVPWFLSEIWRTTIVWRITVPDKLTCYMPLARMLSMLDGHGSANFKLPSVTLDSASAKKQAGLARFRFGPLSTVRNLLVHPLPVWDCSNGVAAVWWWLLFWTCKSARGSLKSLKVLLRRPRTTKKYQIMKRESFRLNCIPAEAKEH